MMDYDEAYRIMEVEALTNTELREAWEIIKQEIDRLDEVETDASPFFD